MQLRGEDLVVLTIATQAPVARDLRFLLTLDRIGDELERIGDSVANVAKRARELAPEPPLDGHVGVPEMGRLAALFLAETIRAMTDADADAAREISRPRRRDRRHLPPGRGPADRRLRSPTPPTSSARCAS